ncbi:hypothetical protein SAMN05444392_101799 [Seinonella peptonophila]|uniref:Uncharacterized protein n=1 Tax=Seinonella peptonophila TaxID=112248 RepID=A0A1M4U3Y9_9BACL|nr:hypothetical protein [Seinonella peptonophila]SHE51448.1 hypothetical protein SAMN05444392_101799 [Seinonella peptonophila]
MGNTNCGYGYGYGYGFRSGWQRLLIFLLVIATIFVFACQGFDGFYGRC